MSNLTKETWTTKDGIELNVREMSTPHLLATIHLIEKTRMNNILAIAFVESVTNAGKEYYSRWPESYPALIAEAERRKLIQRFDNAEKDKDSDCTKISRRK